MGNKIIQKKLKKGWPEEKRLVGRPRHRWEDIRRDLREAVVCDENWLDLAQDKIQWRTFVTAVMNLRVP